MKNRLKKITAFILSITMVLSSSMTVYAGKDGNASGELSDEEWEDVKDEFTDLDDLGPYDDWDHVNWDYPCDNQGGTYKDLAWMVFTATDWNSGTFPQLNFNEYGSSTVETAYLTEEEKSVISDFVRNYKYTTGKFSKRDAVNGTVDNSAYVPIVIACMDTLKQRGYNDDPFAIQQYVSGGTKKYTQYTTASSNYIQNVARLVYGTLIYAEQFYNQYHSPQSANIYKAYAGSEGLYMMIQSVVYSSSFSKSKNGYSESVASEWFDNSGRSAKGYSKWDDFAALVMQKYSPMETKEVYIMDGFGQRVEID